MKRFCFLVGLSSLLFFMNVQAFGFKDPLFQPDRSGNQDHLTEYDDNGVLSVKRYNMWTYDQDIRELYRKTLARIPAEDISKRVELASGYFLSEPYIRGALGEGPNGDFDQRPLYRTDGFDCVTYVSTVLALVESRRFKQFRKNILKVNYQNNRPTFLTRNHFMSADWNPKNQKNGYIKDITADLTGVYKVATVRINKPKWFKRLTSNRIALIDPSKHLAPTALLNMMRADAHQAKAVTIKLPYIPLTAFFSGSKTGKGRLINKNLLDRIPSGAIIELVDLNRETKGKIGTNLAVYHVGFAIRTPEGLMFRDASPVKGSVRDIPMDVYLAQMYSKVKDKSKAGINVQMVQAPKFKKKLFDKKKG